MSKAKGSVKRKDQSTDESQPSGVESPMSEHASGEADAGAVAVVEAGAETAAPAVAAATAVGTEAAPAGAGPVTLELDAGLEIKDVESVHRRLSAALAGATALTVSLSRIATIDTAGVQLLLALRRSAGLERRPLTFTGESAALTQALGVLGLEHALHAGGAGE